MILNDDDNDEDDEEEDRKPKPTSPTRADLIVHFELDWETISLEVLLQTLQEAWGTDHANTVRMLSMVSEAASTDNAVGIITPSDIVIESIDP
jgi:hypothetical protein